MFSHLQLALEHGLCLTLNSRAEEILRKTYSITSGVSESGSGSPNPHAAIDQYYSNSKINNYTTRPLNFNGESTEFEWWKSEMYTHIMGLDDELWDILEDGIDIPVNGVRMVSAIKTLTPTQKKTY